jgi:hypothetical protein
LIREGSNAYGNKADCRTFNSGRGTFGFRSTRFWQWKEIDFAWDGLEAAKDGTGHLPDATRRDLIDAALGYFNCLAADDQKAFATKQAELLKRREGVNGTSGNASTEPPKDCRRQ